MNRAGQMRERVIGAGVGAVLCAVAMLQLVGCNGFFVKETVAPTPTGTVLTAVTGSPIAAGTNVTALALSGSGTYLLAAANGGSPDLAMYGFDATVGGKLNSVATSTTGTDPTGPVAMAATTGATGKLVYVANAMTTTTGTTGTVSGFSIGTGTLTSVAGSPYLLATGFAPTAIAVTPAATVGATNQYVYVGGLATVSGAGAIYLYTVGAGGVLTASNGGSPIALANVQSMDISSDGKWLFVLDQGGQLLYVYAIDPKTGTLAGQIGAQFTLSVAGAGPRMVRVSPNNAYVFIALGLEGDLVYQFNDMTGALTLSQTLATGSTTLADNALAVDANTAYLYIARSGPGGGLMVFTIGAAGALNAVTGSPFATGSQPISVLLDGTGKYLYVANRADSTISEFTVKH